MNKINLIPKLMVLLAIVLCSGCERCNKQEICSEDCFTFVFMTDIHLQPERNAVEGFRKAIDSVNKINPDFVITGGDLIMDALGQSFGRADSLYNLYDSISKELEMPVYNTMGNHEVFGIYNGSGVPKDHPEFGEKMFQKRIGKRYYSFDHKGWHFLILDSVEDTGESKYTGEIDPEQMDWIAADLKDVDDETPIAVSVHIPFITSFMQVLYGSLEKNDSSLVIINSKEVLDLFKGHNLKLVLQGHLHFVEDIFVNGTHFITGGAVSSAWWKGRYNDMEEGFMVLNINRGNFDWKYIDYGWEPKAE